MIKRTPKPHRLLQLPNQEEPEMPDKPEIRGKNYRMSVHFQVLGGHTHLAIWTGPAGFTLGKAGDLTMTNEEFDSWKRDRMQVEFVPILKGEPA